MPEYSQNGNTTVQKKKRKRHVEGPVFSDKVLMALHKMGGSARVDELVKNLTTSDGTTHPRKNNTRREVYKNPELLQLHPTDKQTMVLTPVGQAKAQELISKYGK